jgi:L-fuculose-phosphate aldolase
MSDAALREAVIGGCRELSRRGLSHGTSGNVSVRRDARRFFVSPTGMFYGALVIDDVPLVDLDGHWFGRRRPSSEWRFHRDIYQSRSDVGAVVHTHSEKLPLWLTGRVIAVFHDMVAVAGGCDILCSAYHTFVSQALSDAVVAVLQDRRACLLGHHGVIAIGPDVAAALALAGEVENLSAQYWAALAIGNVRILDDEEMARVIEKFRSYGKQHAVDVDLDFGGVELPDAGP